MREIAVGVVAPAYVNIPLWVTQQRGFLTIDTALQMIPYDYVATDAGFTNLGPVTEESALNAVCISLLGERALVTPFLRALSEAAAWFRGHIEESAAIAAAHTSIEPLRRSGLIPPEAPDPAAAAIDYSYPG